MGKAENRYCAFCKNPRQLYLKRNLSFSNYLQAFGIGFVLSYVIWRELNPKGLVLSVMAMMVIEIGILLRRRSNLLCPHCGFDPVLYKKNRDAACSQVKSHLEARKDDPDVWLARKPPILVSKRRRKNSTREIVI